MTRSYSQSQTEEHPSSKTSSNVNPKESLSTLAMDKISQIVAETSNELLDDISRSNESKDIQASLEDMIKFTEIITQQCPNHPVGSASIPNCACVCHGHEHEDEDGDNKNPLIHKNNSEETTQTSHEVMNPTVIQEEESLLSIDNKETLAKVFQEILNETKTCRCFAKIVEQNNSSDAKVSCETIQDEASTHDEQIRASKSTVLAKRWLNELIRRSKGQNEVPVQENIEEVAEEPIEENNEKLIEKNTEEPNEEETEGLSEETSDEIIEEPTEEPVEEPTEEPIEKVTEEPVEEVTEKLSEETIEKEPSESSQEPTTYTPKQLTQKWLNELYRRSQVEIDDRIEDINEEPPKYLNEHAEFTSAELAQRWLNELIRRSQDSLEASKKNSQQSTPELNDEELTEEAPIEPNQVQMTNSSADLAQRWLDELIRRSKGEIEVLSEFTSAQLAQMWLDECVRCTQEIELKFTSAALAQMLLNEIETNRNHSQEYIECTTDGDEDIEDSKDELADFNDELEAPPTFSSGALAQEWHDEIQRCADKCKCSCHPKKLAPWKLAEKSESVITIVAENDYCINECQKHCPKGAHEKEKDATQTSSTTLEEVLDEKTEAPMEEIDLADYTPVQVIEKKRGSGSSFIQKLSKILKK